MGNVLRLVLYLKKILEINLSITSIIRDEKNLVEVKFQIFLDPRRLH